MWVAVLHGQEQYLSNYGICTNMNFIEMYMNYS
jgi:hypothetical protein